MNLDHAKQFLDEHNIDANIHQLCKIWGCHPKELEEEYTIEDIYRYLAIETAFSRIEEDMINRNNR